MTNRQDPDPYLGAAPFVDWLNERMIEAGSHRTVADWLDVPERQLGRIRAGDQKTVRLSFVDRCLCRLGWHLSDVYPELYEEAA